MRPRVPPALVLLLLAGLIAEVLTGFRPLFTLLTEPVPFLVLLLYYGSAALLAHDLTVRWERGWPTVLALGAAFGVVQEGLGTKVFFDTSRGDLGTLVGYGVAGGVQWPFVVQLVVYHAAYSIGLPVLLTCALYVQRAGTTWTTRRWLVACALCVAVVTLLLALLYHTSPPPLAYGLTFVAAIGLLLLARRLPGRTLAVPLAPTADGVPRVRWFWLGGALAMAAFLVASYAPPAMSLPGVLGALAIALVTLVGGRWLRRASIGWDARRQWALAAGLLTPWLLLAPSKDASGALGTSAAALIVLFVLWRAWRAVSRSAERVVPPSTAAPLDWRA